MTAYITTIARPDGTSWTTVETVDCRTLTPDNWARRYGAHLTLVSVEPYAGTVEDATRMLDGKAPIRLADGERRMTARFASRCWQCGNPIRTGADIAHNGAARAARHIDCPAAPVATAVRAGRCPSYTASQGCPLHGETCR